MKTETKSWFEAVTSHPSGIRSWKQGTREECMAWVSAHMKEAHGRYKVRYGIRECDMEIKTWQTGAKEIVQHYAAPVWVGYGRR